MINRKCSCVANELGLDRVAGRSQMTYVIEGDEGIKGWLVFFIMCVFAGDCGSGGDAIRAPGTLSPPTGNPGPRLNRNVGRDGPLLGI